MSKRTRDLHGRELTSGALVEVYAPDPKLGAAGHDRSTYVLAGTGIVKEIHPHDGTMTVRFADGRAPWANVSPHDVCKYAGRASKHWVDSSSAGQRCWMQYCDSIDHEDASEATTRYWVTTTQPEHLVGRLKTDPTVIAYGSAEECDA